MQNTTSTTNTPSRIHPLMAGAAAAVILVSAVGVAAITGLLPTSHGTPAAAVPLATTAVAPATSTVAPVQVATAPVTAKPAQVVHHHHVVHNDPVYVTQQGTVPAYLANRGYEPAPTYSQNSSSGQSPSYGQAPVYSPAPAPVQAPVAQNSAVGIGIGAVVGGLVGNQVGGGRGKTLATVAGALAGAYAGNELAKRTGN